MNVAVCQMPVKTSKIENIHKAQEMITEAYENGAELIILPEMFNCPYDINFFKSYSEDFPGETTNMLGNLAKKLNVFIVGGSIPERDNDKIYNTSYVFNNHGEVLCKHRKMHLFDIDIKDKIRFCESDILSPGKKVTTFSIGDVTVGVAICYDMRFPELMRSLVDQGAEVIIVPAAFNMTTGPAHWHVTTRARAIDNQVYFIAACSSRNLDLSYHAYGHSLIVDPWGEIISEAESCEKIIYANLDMKSVKRVRQELPLLKHRKKKYYT